jgi:competence protein ComEC
LKGNALKKHSNIKSKIVDYFIVPRKLWRIIKQELPKQTKDNGPGRPPIPHRKVVDRLWYVLWDVGFQLSFAATLGLLLYAEPLTQAFVCFSSRRTSQSTAERLVGPFGEYFLFTLAAQVTTLAVIVYHFRRLSLTSLIANPVILPAQPAVMILGGLAVILGMVWLPLGQVAAYLAWPFVVYTIRAVEFLSRIPGGVYTLGVVALYWVVLFYAVLILLTFGGSRLRAMVPAIKPSLAFAVLGVLTVLIWRAASSPPDGQLHISLLDVGSGEAVLIQSPTGRHMLVNGGPSPSRLSDALGRRLPLTHRRLDYLVVASPSEEGIAALPRTIERYPPDNVLWAGPTHGTRAARPCRRRSTRLGSVPCAPRPDKPCTWAMAPRCACWRRAGAVRSCCWSGRTSALYYQ